LNSLLFMFMRK